MLKNVYKRRWKSDFRYFGNSKGTCIRRFASDVDIEKAFDSVDHCFSLRDI